MNIKNKIIKQDLIEWSKLEWFQSDLKRISETEFEKLRLSLKNSNFIQPFNVWQKSNGKLIILDGHHRKKALEQLQAEGIKIPKKLPANFIEVKNESEAAKLVLIYSSIYANINVNKIEDYLTEHKLTLTNLDGIMLPNLDLSKLKLFEDENEKLDEIPAIPKKAISKLGDLFLLDGRHRVLCGDSTKKEDVKKLMDGKKADMIFTDPPYGVDYSKKNEFLNQYDKGNRIQRNIENDTKTVGDTEEILSSAFKNCFEIMNEYASFYVYSAQGGDMMMMINSLENGGMHYRHMLIWVKNNHILGRCDYNYKHEPILYGWNKKHKFYGGGEQRFSVWNYDKPHKSDLHPTMKPVALIVNALLNSSKANDICLDSFLGSGSTLIACEQTNRICYGMEIDPIYIDVILKRYHNLYPEKKIKCLNRKYDFDKLFN